MQFRQFVVTCYFLSIEYETTTKKRMNLVVAQFQLTVGNNGIRRNSVLSDLSLSTLDDLEDYRLPSEA